MWWALLTIWAGDYADKVAGTAGSDASSVQSVAFAAADGPVDADGSMAWQVGDEPDAQSDAYDDLKKRSTEMLASLSDARRHEVRCAMFAGLIMNEVGRRASRENYGLTATRAEMLADRLSALLIAERGWSAADVRAVYNADFEAFASVFYADGANPAPGEETFATAVGKCQPIYSTIDVLGNATVFSPG